VNLKGWQITAGTSFLFTNDLTIPARGYYVIAANLQSFRVLHAGVNNVVGEWTGSLNNNGENIELTNPAGEVVDELRYASEGDWAIRRRGPLDRNHRGWVWYSEHDGLGKSLELINPNLPNEHGQNWAASGPVHGSPGTRNSVYNTNIAPVILEVGHFPIVPKSSEQVTVNARFADEGGAITPVVWWRTLSNPFSSLDMFDDGEHNDGSADDGVYGAVLPPHGNRTVVEFYVQATDASGNSRTWPAPALDEIGFPRQLANALYQVDDEVYTGTVPIYRLIMTEAERQELDQLNSTQAERNSDAQMNATFITIDPVESLVRYLCGHRIRGAGSRGQNPPNTRLNIPNDRKWKGVDRLSLNCQFTHSQLIGSIVAKRAGLNVADARLIQMRINGQNRAGAVVRQFGHYVAVEVMNSDWAETEFPFDPDGNIYRASRSPHTANLSYYGPDYQTYIQMGYSKESNGAENDWSDLINLTFVMSNAPPEQYLAAVSQLANLRQWMTYFATLSLMEYSETSLGTGRGDDYSMYRGINDPRFLIIAHDFDTIFAQGDTGGNISQNIFQAGNDPESPALQKFFSVPDVVPLYYEALYRLANTTFTADELFPLFDRYLSGWVPADRINAMKTFAMNRRAFVLSQIPVSISVTATNPVVNGYYQASGSTVNLRGRANAIRTRFVLVNGQLADWNARFATWSVNGLPLNPGVNRVMISTFDENGTEFETGFADVWYDIGLPTSVSGAISSSTTWIPAGGPYFVSGTLQVNNSATLTIQPGTSVYLAPGATIEVTSSGRLIAEGTPTGRIRFTRRPGILGNWNEIYFNGAATENRLVNVDIEFAGSNGRALRADNAVVYFDGLSFTNISGTYCDLDNSAFEVRNSVFPSTTGDELIHGIGLRAGGYGIIESNYFGTTTGLNDIIDFTGGQRPGPILQVLNNVFSGASDDVLDLDGADAHVEGNIFMNVQQETPGGDTASAVSGGANGTDTSEITIVRNFFYNCDYAALAKEGNFYTIVNNTMVNLRFAAVNFDEPLRPGITPGRGAYFDGNIVRNAPADFANTNEVPELTVLRSILSRSADPKLVNTNTTLASIRNDLSLRPGSIAIGTGPNALNMGAAVPAGASISGEPMSPTAQTTAVLTVDGPGITHYRYALDGGPFGDETPVSIPIVLSGLGSGTHRVAVKGKNSASVYQSIDTVSRPWAINGAPDVRLNEILARNEAVLVNGETPDMIELYNPGSAPVDLSGIGLTDDQAVPKKFTFPPGSSLGAGEYLTLYADSESGPGIHLGFGLDQNGDGVWLFNANSTLRESITFGFQAADYSIGRLADGSWGLTRPTFGAPNVAQPPADAHYVKINEWLTRGRVLFPEDFVELYNVEPVPADLSGVFFTDAPQAGVRLHQVPALSFVDGYGYVVLRADGNTNAGADHLGFQLSSDQGEIAMFDSDGALIDCVIYGPQAPDVSEGRRPNGAATIGKISPPTPNGPNPAFVPGITVSNVVTALLPMNAIWKYHTNRVDLGTAWRATNYNDSAWPEGPGILADETPGVLPPPGIGTELWTNSPNGYVITYYFRTRFEMPETNMPGATLQASLLIDDGVVIYINGVEAIRRRMNNTSQIYTTLASQNQNNEGTPEIVSLSLTNFQPGLNYIAAEVHQGTLNSSDIVFGMAIETTHLVTNYPPRGLVLNEIMANNQSITNHADNSVTDWVEFLNPSSNTVDLANFSLTDDLGNPQQWMFPPGVTIGPQSYLIVKFDSGSPPSTNAEPVLNTGFGLDDGGDLIFLIGAPEEGGEVLDALAFGVQAADFTISRVPEVFGEWRLSFPTMRAVNVPATMGSSANLRINEWLANPSGNNNDFFEIYNPQPQPVDLSGLHLTDNLDDHTQYRIPDLSFIGVGEQGFTEFIADGDPEDGANHVNFRLNGDGEALGLFTVTGGLIDALSFGRQDNGISEGRFPDGAESTDRFPESATPGASNMRRLANIVINEVLSHTDLPMVDAIELFNRSASSVDISGWFLTDRRNDPRKFRIPDGTVLEPGGFVVFTEADFNPQPGLYPSFALSSSEGEDVFLYAADEAGVLLGYRTDVEFGAAETAVSFGQHETSVGFDFTALSYRTFGSLNAPPKIGPVVINEIMYHPPDIGTENNERDEFIELVNMSEATVLLYDMNFPTNTWRLRDAMDFDFPQGLTLPAGAYLLVVGFDPATNAAQVDAFRTRYAVPGGVPILGPYEGRLSNEDENIELYKPDGPTLQGEIPYIQVDKVRYEDNYPWPSAADGNTNGIGMSLQRRFNDEYGNDPVNWVAAAPTAGAPTAPVSSAVPTISQQPQSRTVIVGANTSFTVVASGQAPLRYQWRFNGVNILRATNMTYSISSAQVTNNGVYTVLVANSLGAVLSARATLTVQTPPSIVSHPQDRLIPPGETAIFTVTAQGTPPLRYQWRFNGADMTGETNTILAISNVQTNKEGLYSVQVSNAYGTTNSQTATLTVRSVPIVAVQPRSTNVFTGSTVTFEVSAFGTAPLRYFWRFNDNPIPGATNTSLTLTNVQLQNAGGYSILITNNIGGTLSAVATLTVTVPPVATVAAFDASASESGGDNAVFTVTRTGTLGTPLDIFFTIGGTAQRGADYSLPSSPVRIPAGSASAQLVLVPVNDGQRESQENVIVTVVGSPQYVVGAAASATATIADDDNSVPQVQIASPADNARFTTPTNINISVIATDADGPMSKVEFFANVTNKLGEDLTSPFAFTWTNPPVGNYSLTARAIDDVDATAVSGPVRIVVAAPGFADMFADRGVMVGYTNYFTGANSAYTKEADEPRHHHNGNGNGTRSAWLSWTAPSSGTVTMNTIGSSFDTVMVIYTNSNPAAPTLANLVRVVSNDDVSNMNVNSEVIFGAVAGVTYQIAMDGYVSGVGGTLVFRMNMPNPNPIILANPTNQLVNPGATVTFSVTAGGPAPLRYQWRFGGNDILNATNSTLTIAGVQAANQGIYTVVVSNNAGFVTSSPATLSLRPPPSITTPLVNRIVNPGGSATFTVGVSGSGPFTYQWRFNGNIISGAAASSLFRNNIQHVQGGTYAVTVSNSAGSTTSEAELIVRPVIVRAALSNSVLLLTIDATPAKPYFVQTGTNLTDWTDFQPFTPAAARGEFQTPVTPTNQLFRLRVP
jgi:hypothetical protein